MCGSLPFSTPLFLPLRRYGRVLFVPGDLYFRIVFYPLSVRKVEWYGPAQVDRQFYLMQMVPLLEITSFNSDLSNRLDLNSSHRQMVITAEDHYCELLSNIIGSLELDAGRNASLSMWLDYYFFSQFDLSTDQRIDILLLSRTSSRIPLVRSPTLPALDVYLAEVGLS